MNKNSYSVRNLQPLSMHNKDRPKHASSTRKIIVQIVILIHY